MGTTYTSTIDVRCLKEHTCLGCGAVYAYDLVRKVTGSSGNKDKALVNARAAVARTVERDVDPHPCPSCGLFQPDMIGQRRAKRHKTLFWLALIGFAVIVILRLAYAIQTDTAVWAGVAACAVVVFSHLGIDLADPNRNLEANKQVASERVTSGVLKHQPGQADPSGAQMAIPGRSMGHKLALLLLLAAVALATEPETMRMMRGWPLNADCYPPVVGPGDQTRIYMDQKIESIKGYWRGRPVVTMAQSGATKKVSLTAETNDNSWGSSISAKSSEKRSNSTPWVKVTVPDDAALAGKRVACDIALNVVYPESQGTGTFAERSQKLSRSVNVQLATASGAGRQYNEWWWTGTVLAMGVILFCGLCLLWAARGLERKAKPTRAFMPDAGNPPPIGPPER